MISVFLYPTVCRFFNYLQPWMVAVGMLCLSLRVISIWESKETRSRLHWFCLTSLCDLFRKLAPLTNQMQNSWLPWIWFYTVNLIEKHSILLFTKLSTRKLTVAWVLPHVLLSFPKIYFIVVVYSFIEALREDPSGTSAGFSSPLTGGNQTQMVITFPWF